MDPGWRRLSRRMLVIHPVQELIRAVPVLAGLLVAGSSSGQGPLWSLAGVAVTIGAGMLRWFTTRYRVTGEQVLVRRGLLRRQVTAVARDRVRTVDVTANAMHRLLGLARLTVGTGRSDRGHGALRLDALRADEAARLREELLRREPAQGEPAAQRTEPGVTSSSPVGPAARELGMSAPAAREPGAAGPGEQVRAPDMELARLDPAWIRFGPFTLSGLVTVGVVAGFLGHFVSEAQVDASAFGPLRAVADHLARAPLALAIAEGIVAALVVVAVASTAGYVLAFSGFRLTRRPGGTLHVTRGLVTTRAITIEERRLHGVELSEPLLLRVVRGARCIAIATGLRVGQSAERGGSLLLPPAPRTEAERVAAAVLGHAEPVTCPLLAHGPRARRRRFTRALAPAALAGCVLALMDVLALLPTWPWQASLALLPAAALLAADRARSLGHAVAAGHLVTRSGSLVRRRCALAREGIIGVNLRRSFFQRRAGLATLTATTAAGRQRYDVTDVGEEAALRLADASLPGLLAPFLERRA